MNRRKLLMGSVGVVVAGISSSARIGVAEEKAAKSAKTLTVLVCPIYKVSDNGSYATYYAMEQTGSNPPFCANPRTLIGPTNLMLGCGGTGCSSRLDLLGEKGRGDDGQVHPGLEEVGCNPAADPFTEKAGVIKSREGVYQVDVKKGGSSTATSIKVRLIEIVVIPSKCSDGGAEFKKKPAVTMYLAQELKPNDSSPIALTFGELDTVKVKPNGHHFKLKVKPTEPHDKLTFTLLCNT